MGRRTPTEGDREERARLARLINLARTTYGARRNTKTMSASEFARRMAKRTKKEWSEHMIYDLENPHGRGKIVDYPTLLHLAAVLEVTPEFFRPASAHLKLIEGGLTKANQARDKMIRELFAQFDAASGYIQQTSPDLRVLGRKPAKKRRNERVVAVA